MAAFDKLNLRRKLIAIGWKETAQDYELIPPDDLWEKRPKTFFVYDAETLSELLGRSVDKDGDGDVGDV